MRYLFLLLLAGCAATGPIPIEDYCDEPTQECFDEFEKLCITTGGGFITTCSGLGVCTEYNYFCNCTKWKDGCKEI